MATNRLQWFKDWLTMDHPYGQSDSTERELKRVEWEEEKELEWPKITERFVWSGGAEKTITHVDWDYRYLHNEFFDEDGVEIDFTIDETPAYREIVERDTHTETRTMTKTAWVDGDIPESVTETGETKTVYEP